MKRIFFFTIFIIFFLTSCGFKLVNLENNYSISEIQTSGDKRINYKIKNKILNNSKKNHINQISIKINTKQQKTIKEKNISNQITKYEIKIISDVEFNSLSKEFFSGKFSVSKSGDYNVSQKYSDTLINEKNIVKTLINDLTYEIFDNLASNLNDL